MTTFDIIALGVLGLSVLVGFIRGAVREVVTAFAFVLAAIGAIFLLRFSGPLGRSLMDPDWLGTAVALLCSFIALYILIRLAGGTVTRRIHQESTLGTVDRLAGLGVGLVRGLLVLGVFHLVFSTVTPRERVPAWVARSWTYPLARASGNALAALAPRGSAVAGRFGPAIEEAVREGVRDDTKPQPPSNDSAVGDIEARQEPSR